MFNSVTLASPNAVCHIHMFMVMHVCGKPVLASLLNVFQVIVHACGGFAMHAFFHAYTVAWSRYESCHWVIARVPVFMTVYIYVVSSLRAYTSPCVGDLLSPDWN